MIVPSVVRRQFEEWRPFVCEVRQRVEETLIPYTQNVGYVYEGRLKTIESLAEKLESGRYREWEHIEDLYASTIAVSLPNEEPLARKYLSERFRVIEERHREQVAKIPEEFRFDSTRMILQLRPPPGLEVGPVPNIFAVRFEVQVKTIYDFAWSKTTHALTYKGDSIDWRRYRLAAHLKAASEQIDFLLRGFEDTARYLEKSPWGSIQDKARVADFFRQMVERRLVPREVAPDSWSRFSDNVYRALQALDGQRPSGSSRRGLQGLGETLENLERHFMTLEASEFPRSVSLYQYTVGYLASTMQPARRQTRLNFLNDANLEEVFPDALARVPGELFSLD